MTVQAFDVTLALSSVLVHGEAARTGLLLSVAECFVASCLVVCGSQLYDVVVTSLRCMCCQQRAIKTYPVIDVATRVELMNCRVTIRYDTVYLRALKR